MTEFTSVFSYQRFANRVMREWRYLRDPEQEAFLATLLATSEERAIRIPTRALLYRAQEGCIWPAPDKDGNELGPMGFDPDRMKPVPGRGGEGRANARGIPCLYTATVIETAVAEVRPWMGAYVSVAELRVRRHLTIMNCSSERRETRIYLAGEPDAKERERAVWADIDRAFARPISRADHIAEYAPTQVIAEMFHQEGYDGIGYRSSLGEGLNIALFDLNDANVIGCAVWDVSKIIFKSSQVGNAYVVTKRNSPLRKGRRHS